MSLLSSIPHRCTIRKRTRTKGTLGGSKDSWTDVQTDVECWEQNASQAEITAYEKRGMTVSRKVFFPTDPSVTVQHQVLITSRDKGITTISSPVPLDVKTESRPDASAGLGVAYKVMVDYIGSSEN